MASPGLSLLRHLLEERRRSPSPALGGLFALAAHPEHMATEGPSSSAGLVQMAPVSHLGARGGCEGPRAADLGLCLSAAQHQSSCGERRQR